MCAGADALTAIRPILRSDRAPIHEILEETGAFTEEEVSIALELIDVALDREGQEDYEIFTALGDGGEVAGYICIGPTPATIGTFDLYWIAVKPSYHGKRVARDLLRYVEELLKPRGGRLLIAETSSQPHYDRTRTFYERTDFIEAARIKDYYKVGDDLVVYAKYLS